MVVVEEEEEDNIADTGAVALVAGVVALHLEDRGHCRHPIYLDCRLQFGSVKYRADALLLFYENTKEGPYHYCCCQIALYAFDVVL